jgi:hypothetical protein
MPELEEPLILVGIWIRIKILLLVHISRQLDVNSVEIFMRTCLYTHILNLRLSLIYEALQIAPCLLTNSFLEVVIEPCFCRLSRYAVGM